MSITPLPTPAPSRQDPATFSDRSDENVAAMPIFVTEANQLAEDVNADEVSAAASKDAAEAAEALAEQYKDMASSTANFKGEWGDLTGAAAVPYSVIHNSVYYQLLNDIPDIAASEPGVTSDYAVLHDNYTVKDNSSDASPGFLEDKVGKYTRNKSLLINPNMVVNQDGYVDGAAVVAGQHIFDCWKVHSIGTSPSISVDALGNITLNNVMLIQSNDNLSGESDGNDIILTASVSSGSVLFSDFVNESANVPSNNPFTFTFNSSHPVVAIGSTTEVQTFSGLKLEEGAIATGYGKPHVTEEALKCYRYFLKLSEADIGIGHGYDAGSARISIDLPCEMSVVHTLSYDSNIELLGNGTAVSNPGLSASIAMNSNKITFLVIDSGYGIAASEVYVLRVLPSSTFTIDARP